jgi:hypothetical protein
MTKARNVIGGVVPVGPVLSDILAPLSPGLRLGRPLVVGKSGNIIRRTVLVRVIVSDGGSPLAPGFRRRFTLVPFVTLGFSQKTGGDI